MQSSRPEAKNGSASSTRARGAEGQRGNGGRTRSDVRTRTDLVVVRIPDPHLPGDHGRQAMFRVPAMLSKFQAEVWARVESARPFVLSRVPQRVRISGRISRRARGRARSTRRRSGARSRSRDPDPDPDPVHPSLTAAPERESACDELLQIAIRTNG